MPIPLTILIVAYTVGFTSIIYFCVIADADKNFLAAVFQRRLPSKFLNLTEKLFGSKVKKILNRTGNYIFHEENCLLQIVYATCMLIGWGLLMAYCYPLLPNLYMDQYHQNSGILVFVTCISSWWIACKSTPGIITKETIVRFDNYPYDDLLYTNVICPTVGIRKLPRSKYDRNTKGHVARFDHYCGWLGNTVGEENYRWFLCFLVCHVGMFGYGTVALWLSLASIVDESDLWNAKFYNAKTRQVIHTNGTVVMKFIINQQPMAASLLLICAVLATTLSMFVSFHLYLIYCGMTTNEFFKWGNVKRWYKEELKRFELESAAQDDLTKSNESDSAAATKRVKKPMHPGLFPKNIYNGGFVNNMTEVLFPRSRRRDAKQKWLLDTLSVAEKECDNGITQTLKPKAQ
mmetsp:Transcript_29048/g.35406  ORF Transcript_29048/g.35406 Transcript_29048/m.35406 type:complete len:404 (+) Transcript_29048:85-1296(+)